MQRKITRPHSRPSFGSKTQRYFMGIPTGKFFRITKSTGKSSDYFGPCEICKKHMSEVFRSSLSREWKRDNGEIYYGNESPAIYAHEQCINTLK